VGRLIALLLGGFGLSAYLRRRRRRRPEPEFSPAEELRSKLAESRAPVEAEPSPESVEQSLDSELERRRREVHDRARGSIDDLS
jgi:hypothetical protein